MSDPALPESRRKELVDSLMKARRAVRTARQSCDAQGEKQAHEDVDDMKVALGERGAVWWDDGAPDFNRHSVRNTPYAAWFAGLGNGSDQ